MAGQKLLFEETGAVYGNCPLAKVYPSNYVLPITYKQDMETMINLEVRPDDIWLMGLPKSGTTWATEMIWGVYHEGDLTEAKRRYPTDRWTEMETSANMRLVYYGQDEKIVAQQKLKSHPLLDDAFDKLQKMKSPRFIRSHIPLSFLPPYLVDTCKCIYIARNFKDIIVSFYKMTEGGPLQHVNSIEATCEEYLQDRAWFSPISEHLKEAWRMRHHKNMYFLLYEDMKKDLPGVIRKMAQFLNKKLTEEQIKILVNHLSVESMRKNPYANMSDLVDVGWLPEGTQFIRKGISGDWKNHFSPQLLEKYNSWWKSHMGDIEFEFPED